jgi:hypothetical protein
MSKAKDKKSTKVDEQDIDLGVANDLDFSVPEEMEELLKEVVKQEDGPTFQPGKPGFEVGKTLAGFYLGTRRIYSSKFRNPKIEKGTGLKYKDRHFFKHPKAGPFGIWAVGTTAPIFSRIPTKEPKFIAMTYLGLAEKPFKEGQSRPHMFTFKGDGISIEAQEFEDIYQKEAAAKKVGCNAATGEMLEQAAQTAPQ